MGGGLTARFASLNAPGASVRPTETLGGSKLGDTVDWEGIAARADRKCIENLHSLYPELAAGAEVPSGPLGLVKLRFAEAFAFWTIGLPEDDIVCGRRGSISVAGWSISYLFDSDEKGEFLDYYSHHRMTSDSHVRLYADGRVEGLPCLRDLRPCSQDPVEDERLKAEYFDHNRRVSELLRGKGFCGPWHVLLT